MPHERFFIDQPLEADQRVFLKEQEFHHLTRVMRARVGTQIELVNGMNQLAEATLADIGKHEAALNVSEVKTQTVLKPEIILAQGIPRLNRLEYILEKGTELDATQFWLFPGLLSEKDEFSHNQHKRITQITISAMKQCGRLDLPSIHFKPPLLQWQPIQGCLLFGDTSAEAPPLSNTPPMVSPVIIFIGPEKGFDPKETAFLQNTLQAKGIKLHRNILRVDTAAITALSLISSNI